MEKKTRSNKSLNGIFKRGHQKDWAEIYYQLKSLAFYRVLKQVKNAQDAEDVIQNAIFQLYKNKKQFRGDSELESYFYVIVQREVLQFLRKKKRYARLEQTLDHAKVINLEVYRNAWLKHTRARDRLLQVQRCLKYLNKSEQYAIMQKAIGAETSEIAKKTGENVNTVKTRINRARIFLAHWDNFDVTLRDKTKNGQKEKRDPSEIQKKRARRPKRKEAEKQAERKDIPARAYGHN